MSQPSTQRHLLYPLDIFYALEDQPTPRAEEVSVDDLPQGARALLDHDRDMTGTLEQHYNATLRLQVLNSHRRRTAFLRKVLLTPSEANQPVEFGAIAIHLRYFDLEPQQVILECRKPLGAILREYEVEYSSKVSGFVRVDKAPDIRKSLRIKSDEPLFGRRNVLHNVSGEVMAEVLELLPPDKK